MSRERSEPWSEERWLEEPMDWIGGYVPNEDPPAPPAPAPDAPTPAPPVKEDSAWLVGVAPQAELVVVGAFLPLHLGHQSLLRRVSGSGRKATVVVVGEPDDPVPAHERASWLRSLGFDGLTVVTTDASPERALAELRGGRAVALVSADEHDRVLSQAVGAPFVLVPRDEVAPATSAQIRAEPRRHWGQLTAAARERFALRVCLIGPEGAGKSTLASHLAGAYHTRWVPETLRAVVGNTGQALQLRHVEDAAQRFLLDAASIAALAERVVFLDTDLLSLTLWSDRVLGSHPAWLDERPAHRPVDLYLLPEPLALDNLPRVPGVGRDVFFLRCQGAVAERPSVVLRGTLEERLSQAREAIEPLLDRPLW